MARRLSKTFNVGRLTCHTLEGGRQHLDGGAMFGVVQRGELDFATHTNERTAGSYLPHNFPGVPFELIDGDTEILPGIRGVPTPGHVPYHQSILVQSGGETACFVADLVPTAAHLPLPWIMGYDLEPLRTLESKRRLLADAVAGGWRLIFEHDPSIASGIPVAEGKGVVLTATMPGGIAPPSVGSPAN